jgi:hypothetical protein
MHPTDVAAPGGVSGRLVNVAVRWPLLVIGCWITVVGKLGQDERDVKTVQDFISTPPLREVLTSKDNGRRRHVQLLLRRVPVVVRNGRSKQLPTDVLETAVPSHMRRTTNSLPENDRRCRHSDPGKRSKQLRGSATRRIRRWPQDART